MANRPWRSLLDGIGNGLGYGAILIIVALIRELFGKGTLFAGSPLAWQIIGPSPTICWIPRALVGWVGIKIIT